MGTDMQGIWTVVQMLDFPYASLVDVAFFPQATFYHV